jgi:hypothetical protein
MPSILGVVVGALLALANFSASLALLSVAIRSSKTLTIALLLGTFLGRLGLISVAFYWVAKTERIDLPSALLAFAVSFTVLMVCEVLIIYRKVQVSNKMTSSGVRAK